jgi:hypothetical protein
LTGSREVTRRAVKERFKRPLMRRVEIPIFNDVLATQDVEWERLPPYSEWDGEGPVSDFVPAKGGEKM